MYIMTFYPKCRCWLVYLLKCLSRKWVTCVGESCVSAGWYQLQGGCVISVSHQVAAHYVAVVPGLSCVMKLMNTVHKDIVIKSLLSAKDLGGRGGCMSLLFFDKSLFRFIYEILASRECS